MADDAIEKVKQIYRDKLRNSKEIQKYKEQILNGEDVDRALNLYSQAAGSAASSSLIEAAGETGVTKEVLDTVMRENFKAVINASKASQASHNEETETQLGSPDIEFDGSDEDSLLQRIAEYEDPAAGIESVMNDLMLDSQKYSDEYMQRSADFQSESGFEVLVSREYDDVGIHTTDKGGGEPCQWCIARCGNDVPYKLAYERGMFERHPGCGCIITYQSKKGKRTVQGKDGVWREASDSEAKKTIAFSNAIPNEKRPEQKIFEASLDQYGKNNLQLAIIENHDALKYYRPQELKQIFIDKGYNVLSSAGQGYYKKNPDEANDVFRVLFGGDGSFRYHPKEHSHHGGAYYKLTKQGVKKWYNLNGVDYGGYIEPD